MKILTRYVIRAHIGPFLFAFTAVTGLLYLNAIAQRMENLAGRGLGVDVIAEFMLYSFPHVAALTFPMAVLVAVLYTFSDLTGQNEVMAMAAGGVRPTRLLWPVLVVGVGLTAFMFWFNAHVLPNSNHRLSTLMADIGSANPTLELREGVVNEVSTGDGRRFFLEARQIDATTNTLSDVIITDLSRMGENRRIVAKSGEMAFTADRADLYVTLHDGVALAITDDRPGAFDRMDFDTQILPMRGVGAEIERRVSSGTRGDREMTIPQLQEAAERQLEQMRTWSTEGREASVRMVQSTLGLPLSPRGEGEEEELEDAGVPEDGMLLPTGLMDGNFEDLVVSHRINNARWQVHRSNVYRYRVEIHKKYAIAFACIIFILLGAPFAIRFPQGGVGMVIATSVGIFFLYWMGLIGGERIAERGHVEPWVAMWLPNMILFLPGVLLATGMGEKLSTNRGSGWDNLRYRVSGLFRRGGEA
ncbi:MAG: YjgP/YjgQ family permease [Gemmatimonadales bacterium]|nr:MAG: YjgP/YjgQ family permease [Gemmatimonadales bacterium]